MKKIYSLLAIILIGYSAQAQVTVFAEDFEAAVSMTSSSFSGSGPAWTLNSTYQSQGLNSYSNVVTTSDTLWLTSPSFNTTGNTFVTLDFDHICKVDFFDGAIIQVSNNNGASWTQLTGAQYLGTSSFAAQGNKFTAAAYSIWDPGNATASPDNNTWWQHETFDVSALLANSANAMVRFALFDGNANGASGNYGWILDDIEVVMAPCELVPPAVTLNPPSFSGQVFFTGPYNISADASDASGVDSVKIFYTVYFGGGGSATDSIMMTNTSGITYGGTIPAQTVGDSVCYYVQAWDGSACLNVGVSSTSCFKVNPNAPPSCNGTIVTNFPATENFDAFTVGVPGTFLNDWANDTGNDNHDWRVHTGTTSSSNTGPTSDHTTGSGNYLYIEASGFSLDSAFLIPPCYDLNALTNPHFQFWYHMYGSSMGSLHLDIFWGNQWVRDIMPPIVGDQGNVWNFIEVDLTPYGNSIVQLRLRGEVGTSFGSDIAIDDAMLYDKLPDDIYPSAILQPLYINQAGVSSNVEMEITNFGVNAQTSFNVGYSVNGGPAVIEPWTGNLASGAKVNHVFATPITVPAGPYTLCVFTDLPTDMAVSNDTLCETLEGIPTYIPTYETNFDTGYTWVQENVGGGTMWELGTPNFGVTNNAYSAPNSWDINLNTGYNLNGEAYLYTQFFDLSSSFATQLEFWYNINTPLNQDGFRLEYTIDGGVTWQVLGTVNDPLAQNWYNSTSLLASGLPGWSNNSNGWTQAYYQIGFLDGQSSVQFRFAFNSNNYTNSDGVSIDDFAIISPMQYDLEMLPLSSPLSGCSNGNSEPVTVCVYNAGYDTIFTYDVSYQLAGSPNGLVTETINTPLLPLDTFCHTFATTEDLLTHGNYLFDYYVHTPLDQNTANDSILGDTVSSYSGCNAFIKIVTGYYATQLSWDVIDNSNNQTIYSIPAGTYTASNTTYYDTIPCLASGGSYNLVMNHSQYSNGQWVLTGYDTVSYGGASFNGLTQTNFQFTAQCPPELSTEMRGVIIPGMILPLPDTYNILGRYRNDGLTKIDSVDITLEIDGSIIATEKAVPTAALDFDDQDVHTFAPQWNAMPGCHDIRIWTSNPNGGLDNYMVTDTVYREVCIIDSTSNYPYCNDFDSGLPDWATLNAYSHKSGTSWEFGTPNQTIINGAHSGNNAWMTRLDTNYYDKLDSSALYSPLFTVDTVECYKLEFWHQYDTEANADGGGIEYSLDKGATWQLLGSYQDTVNWYNSDYITGYMNQDGFSGTSNGWEQSSYTMKFFNQGKVLFRFRFATNGSSALDGEGWAVDDVCFETAGNCGIVGIGDIEIAGYDLGQNVPNPTRGNTTISYTIPEGDQVSFSIVNVLGQEMYMEEGMKQSGEHKIEIDASEWGDGVYYYMLTYKGSRKVKKLIITK